MQSRDSARVADLLSRNVDVIVANQAHRPLSWQRIRLFLSSLLLGVIPSSSAFSSLSRPGGSVTGLTFLEETVASKHLEIVRELVPQAASIAMLIHPASTGAEFVLKDSQNAARVFGLQLEVMHIGNDDHDLETAFAGLSEKKVKALVVPGDVFLLSRRDRIVALASSNSIPGYLCRQRICRCWRAFKLWSYPISQQIASLTLHETGASPGLR